MTRSGLSAEPEAFIFSPVHRSDRATPATVKPLSTRALEDISARAWQEAGPSHAARLNKNRYRSWSGHRARVGAAVDMATRKYSTAQIMQEGTWKKAATVMRYIRHVDARAGAMVDFMDAHINA